MSNSLFDTFKIKDNLILKNRISMAALYLGYEGHSKEYRDFYLERAKGGIGMMIIPQSTGEPLDSWLDPNFHLGFKPLIDEAHKYGTKVILQIYEPIEDINTISKEELDKLPLRYAEAAKGIKDSGFDGMEIHGAHYMPFISFLSPTQNKRKDKYGGNYIGRTKIIFETIKAVKKVIGKFPLFYRVSAADFVENGIDLNLSIPFVKNLESLGVDCIDVSAGTGESPEPMTLHPKANVPTGCFINLAEAIKKEVKIPVICVGRINNKELAQDTLDKNRADIISFGRALIADPELTNKMKENRDSEIIKCLYCNKGCLKDSLLVGKPINCFVNPRY